MNVGADGVAVHPQLHTIWDGSWLCVDVHLRHNDLLGTVGKVGLVAVMSKVKAVKRFYQEQEIANLQEVLSVAMLSVFVSVLHAQSLVSHQTLLGQQELVRNATQ